MGKRLEEIVAELRESPDKVQLLYAFNGTGKTRLSKMFTQLISSDDDSLTRGKTLYYNAFTEDLFYWDNDLENDLNFKMKIQPNSFISWIIRDQGQDQKIISNFQQFTNDKLTPKFDLDNNEITFTFERGTESDHTPIKLSKGEESNFIWSIFYTLLEAVLDELNIDDPLDRATTQFNDLEYIFIDDPVSSLDENHIIAVASYLGTMIKKSKSTVKFIITTHNPLFFNVLANELSRIKRHEKRMRQVENPDTGEIENYLVSEKVSDCSRYRFEKSEDGTYNLLRQADDSPFAYHHFLRKNLHQAIETSQVYKYHFNFLRNLYEKTSTFLGYQSWQELLPKDREGNFSNYESRIINIASHAKISSDEEERITPTERTLLGHLLEHLERTCNYKE